MRQEFEPTSIAAKVGMIDYEMLRKMKNDLSAKITRPVRERAAERNLGDTPASTAAMP
jgi:hypothetical protein